MICKGATKYQICFGAGLTSPDVHYWASVHPRIIGTFAAALRNARNSGKGKSNDFPFPLIIARLLHAQLLTRAPILRFDGNIAHEPEVEDIRSIVVDADAIRVVISLMERISRYFLAFVQLFHCSNRLRKRCSRRK